MLPNATGGEVLAVVGTVDLNRFEQCTAYVSVSIAGHGRSRPSPGCGRTRLELFVTLKNGSDTQSTRVALVARA